MTSELFIASLDQGGAPMMGALLAIGNVGGLVYPRPTADLPHTPLPPKIRELV